jgi:hypothetical protein
MRTVEDCCKRIEQTEASDSLEFPLVDFDEEIQITREFAELLEVMLDHSTLTQEGLTDSAKALVWAVRRLDEHWADTEAQVHAWCKAAAMEAEQGGDIARTLRCMTLGAAHQAPVAAD